MTSIERYEIKIDGLRHELETLIREKHGNLLDENVVQVSKKLNDMINKYYMQQ